MKIAVTYTNEIVEQHFGQAKEFKIYTIEKGEIKNHEVISTEGYEHGTLVDLLTSNNVDTLICGGLGVGAKTLVTQANIKLVPGVQGNADDAVKAYLAEKLDFDPEASCIGGNH